MGEGLKRVAKMCGGIVSVPINGKQVYYDGRGRVVKVVRKANRTGKKR